MTQPSLIQLMVQYLRQSEQALTPREIARALLNDRRVSDITLDALTERLQVDLELERHTRGDTSRFISQGEGYVLTESEQSADLDLSSASLDLLEKQNDSSTLELNTTLSLSSSSNSSSSSNLTQFVTELALRNYPLDHQVSTMLSLTHGERHTLIESLRRSLRRIERELNTQKHIDGEQTEREEPLTIEQWMSMNLSGGAVQLARRIWEGSGRLISPQQFESCWLLIEYYQLMGITADGTWRLNERGMQLVNSEFHGHHRENEIVRELDEREGLTGLLMVCLELGQPEVDALTVAWSQFLRQAGKRKSKAWITDAARSRLRNLSARGLLIRELNAWRLTEEGLAWLRGGGIDAPSADHEALEVVWSALRRQRVLARESMANLLGRMDPHRFEELICELLERMGYEEIHLTTRAHDMGVDVVATIELGITSAREVIQVKRQHRAIHRPVLDALRGSLHRFNAVRGTLITISSFSKGTQEAAFERGAAPITLIDGNRLIDLLMTHELGVKPIEVKLWQVDPRVFEETSGRVWPRWSPSNLEDDKR